MALNKKLFAEVGLRSVTCHTDSHSLLHDLILCYKIVFGLINVQCDEFFAFSILSTRGHPYKFVKASCSTSCRSQFFN